MENLAERKYWQFASTKLKEIVDQFSELEVSSELRTLMNAEIDLHKRTLEAAFEWRKASGSPRSGAVSDDYFREKLGKLVECARMAIDSSIDGRHQPEQLKRNVNSFKYMVDGLTDAWLVE